MFDMDNKSVIIGIVIGFVLGYVFVAYGESFLNTSSIASFLSPNSASIQDINANPVIFVNKSISVKGTFSQIVPLTNIDYEIVDSQGLRLLVSAPNRDLSSYNGKDVTVEGIIKSNNCSGKMFCTSLYLEMSRIS